MSGGSLRYICWKIDEAAKEMARQAEPGVTSGFTDGERDWIRVCANVLRITGEIAHDIEWILDCDYGPDDLETEVAPKLRKLRDLITEEIGE